MSGTARQAELEAAAAETARWIRTEGARYDYADLTITIKLDAARPVFVERGVTEKLKLAGLPGANYARR